MRQKYMVRKAFGFLLLLVFIAITIFPFLWLVITAFKHPADISLMPTELWPSRFSLTHFKDAIYSHHLGVYLKNSVIVGIGTTVLTIIFALPAAYAFARLHFKYKKIWKNFILLANMFPIIAIVSPVFVLFKNWHILNTYWALIIPSILITLPMAIWTLVSFIDTIPYELEEAAHMDGCGWFHTILSVVAPLAAPGIFTTAIIAFITAWNEFMFSLVLVTRDEMRTVPVAISMFPGQYTVPWGDMAAASVIATVPIVIVVLIFQRKIISGLTSGAVKG